MLLGDRRLLRGCRRSGTAKVRLGAGGRDAGREPAVRVRRAAADGDEDGPVGWTTPPALPCCAPAKGTVWPGARLSGQSSHRRKRSPDKRFCAPHRPPTSGDTPGQRPIHRPHTHTGRNANSGGSARVSRPPGSWTDSDIRADRGNHRDGTVTVDPPPSTTVPAREQFTAQGPARSRLPYPPARQPEVAVVRRQATRGWSSATPERRCTPRLCPGRAARAAPKAFPAAGAPDEQASSSSPVCWTSTGRRTQRASTLTRWLLVSRSSCFNSKLPTAVVNKLTACEICDLRP